MKTMHKISWLFIAFNLWTLLQTTPATAQVSVSFQIFYDNLSPYGNWVRNPSYGYVWIPSVGVGFTPYHTNGYWAYTEYGWTWISNYSWGWAPFHYGRWYYDPYYGWVWVPDTEWGPAWVCWRSSADYYGWAPIGPGISISVAYSSGYRIPHNHWTFVRNRDFGRTNINRYYVNNSTNTTIINNTTVINTIRRDKGRNISYALGPDRVEVQRRTGKNIAAIAVKDRTEPGQRNTGKELQLFRPKVQKNNPSGNQPRPMKVAEMKDLKKQQPLKTTRTEPARSNPKIEREKPQSLPQRPPRTESPKLNPPRANQPKGTAPKMNEPRGTLPGRENQNRNQAPATIPQPRQMQPGNNRDKMPYIERQQRINQPENRQPQRKLEPNTPRIQHDNLPGNELIR